MNRQAIYILWFVSTLILNACSSSAPCVLAQQDPLLSAIQPHIAFDTNFNKNGQVVTDFRVTTAVQSLFLLANGNILAAGISGHDITLAEYLPDGTPNSNYGSSGIMVLPLTFAPAQIAFQSNGSLLVAGTLSGGTKPDSMLIQRIALNATIDLTFGTVGFLTIPFSSVGTSKLNAISVQSNDGFTVVGTVLGVFEESFPSLPIPVAVSTTVEVALFRSTANGEGNFNFGVAGLVDQSNALAGAVMSDINAASTATDGSLYLAGDSYNSNGQQLSVMRFDAYGLPDVNFGTDARAQANLSGGESQANFVAIDGLGNILAGGQTFNGGGSDLALARFTANGIADNHFATNGVLTVHQGDASTAINLSANAVLFYPDGRFLVAGQQKTTAPAPNIDTSTCVTLTQNVSETQFLLYRFLNDGSVDTSFGNQGQLSFNFNSPVAIPYTLSFYPQSGSLPILIAGETGGSFGLALLMP